ncbi:hypothetical protein Z517_00095 [Fonsecaea pedrosoi CBS 271.37]|uniref:Uncharacterized protein n=1 Tax=Fonsecaea pedrosoi CBS 271.37 TaxID=1442368 RepID=A0A0D2FDL1_9EURO|nr:uncharacterized protein Z517_00095 [Fonsecaea pedrosoi CBS 271.37]KIW84707.1 hypothetical protein Z517_00095 [Fonsecaea pedrosoi CBS 271.37]
MSVHASRISPEVISGISFGVIMFFIAMYALWQTHQANRHRQRSDAVVLVQGRRQQADVSDQV